ncbi:MAG: RluA family pseudouridine synthase [Candidatus Riflebacteria bacterium]|nr:RluA family pseudouridine synthase [Candidatus Riflebacteria bacterium]
MEFHVEVSGEDRGLKALEIVVSQLEDFLEHFIAKLFAEGHVRCGERAIRADQTLPPGTTLSIEVPREMTPNIGPKPYPVVVLLEDDRILAVDKPSGLSMFPGLGFEQITLFEAVWHRLKGTGDRPRIVNRIDKGTSGVVLFARDAAAQAHLAGQFQRREVLKVYRALVTGRIQGDEGEIDLPLAPHPGRPEMMIVDHKQGKEARTRWRVSARFGHATELWLTPLTGRTHQIRVHLGAIGHPLVVDPVYGSAAPLLLSSLKRNYRHKEDPERPLLARTPLHAARLDFRHPVDDRSLSVEAPLPKDLAVCLKQLARWDPQ